MDRPTIFVGHPGERIAERPWLHADNAALYDTLLDLLDEGGYRYVLGGVKRAPRRYDVVLAHHTNVRRPNVWNLKKGYLPGLMYWDRCGYSGWAEIAGSRELYERSQALDAGEARAFVERFAADYVAANASKFPQDRPGRTRIPPDTGPFEVEEPYVFVACQRARDSVARWSRIGTRALARKVVRAFRGTGHRVVVKCHPQDRRNHLLRLGREPHVIVSQHSIHRILPGASAVITVNSGVGFEALLHGKVVYTAGHSDYHWVTRPLANDRDVAAIASELSGSAEPSGPTDAEAAATHRFLAFMLREYFVDAHDPESVRRRLDRTLEEWRASVDGRAAARVATLR